MRGSAVSLIALLALTSGCAAPAADARKEQRSLVSPINSVVRPIKPEAEKADRESILRSYLNGQPLRTSTVRRPSGPIESILVPCNRTRSIGVYIEVDSVLKIKGANPPLRFSWSHRDLDPNEPVFSRFRGPLSIAAAQGYLFYWDFLNLTKANRINGEWLLTVHHLGEEIYREEFELFNCEIPYAPDWYDDGKLGAASE